MQTHGAHDFWELHKNKNCTFPFKVSMNKAILNTKEYVNINESNYFNITKNLLGISKV